MSGTLVLIDGHYYSYRYFFGMPGLTGPGNRPTGVTHAFAQLFKSLREDASVTHLALIFDHPGGSFRNRIYPDYKAHRDPMPEPLRAQIPDVQRLARESGVPVLSVPEVEGDDVLAALARRAADEGLTVRICTKDKDIAQIIDERIHLWDPVKNHETGPAELEAEKGLRPDQVVDYLCMVGDSSDNVPGITGVGPKTALKLLAEHGSLTAVLAAAPTLKGKLRERVEEFRPLADLTRRLITLAPVAGLPPVADLVKVPTLPEAAKPFYEELGFAAARYFKPQVSSATRSDDDWRIVDAAGLAAFAAEARAAGRCAVDTETTSLDPLTAELVGVSLACGRPHERSAIYVPFAGMGRPLVAWADAEPHLRAILEQPGVGVVMQNAKYDARIFARRGIRVRNLDGDPMLASWLLDPAREGHGIDFLARAVLGEEKIPTHQVIDLAAGQTMAEVEVDPVARYACEDAQCAWRLAHRLETLLAEQDLLTVYREQELPLALCLADLEDRGVRVDRAVLAGKQRHLEDYLAQIERDIRRIAGPDFNPASPKQVADLLFTRLGLPVQRTTKTGPSTDAAVLEALRPFHEAPDLLLQHRTLSKLISSYLKTLPDFIHAGTGRIHTHLRQTGTETGRLSSDQPNLQNIPKRSDLGRELRAAFVPDPGNVFIAADYSQIELRVLAHFSGDPTLGEAFATGADIHRFVAARVHGIAEAAVTPQQRNAAKAVNFGIIYGQTPFGLAQSLGIPRAEAAAFIDDYFRRFAKVRLFIDEVVAGARARGYVTTLAGRRRYVPQIASSNRNEAMQGERTALNSTIQGSAADLIKRAMLRCETMLPAACRLLLQIHDELLVEAPAGQAEAAAAALREAMTGAWRLDVPLVADLKTGADWLAVS